jgi:hypothetical protein
LIEQQAELFKKEIALRDSLKSLMQETVNAKARYFNLSRSINADSTVPERFAADEAKRTYENKTAELERELIARRESLNNIRVKSLSQISRAGEESNGYFADVNLIIIHAAGVLGTINPELDRLKVEIESLEAEDTLYLLTEEQGKVVWRCIDLATREEQQRLELNEYHSTGNVYQVCHQMDIVEDGLVIISGDNSFAYLEEKNGIFEKKIIANLGDGPGVGDDGYCYDLMYRDGKAALVIAEGLETSTEVYVYVLGEKGVEYKAHFMPSFAYESYHGDMNWIHLRKEAPLEIIMK